MNWVPYLWVALYLGVVLVVFLLATLKKNKSLPTGENQPFVRAFFVFYMFLTIGSSAIIYQIVNIQYEQGDQLRQISQDHFPAPKQIRGKRGNILSEDGKILSATTSYYILRMDTKAEALQVVNKETGRTYFDEHVGELARAFANKFGVDARKFESDLRKAHRKGNRNYLLYPNQISYIDYLDVKKFPILERGKTKGGFKVEERIVRERPFGSLAQRTIGEVFAETKRGYSGLESHYDSTLTGKEGLYVERKQAGRTVQIITKEPTDGMDVVSTINIDLQEIAESALRERLTWCEADRGCVVLMEVATGKIRAISNLGWSKKKKEYIESENYAMGSQIEPGSTFKTLSFLTAIEDGYIDSTTLVNTLNGRMNFSGSWMKDHNGRGFGIASVSTVMYQSSNVGVSALIQQHYGRKPQKFIDGLRRTGISDTIKMEIPGHGEVRIKNTDSKYWSATSLPWMSIGYEVSVPPIYTLMLYNAIANNGTMVKPLFTEGIMKDGQYISVTPVEVVKEKIASDRALNQMRGILEGVVAKGTAKNMQSPLFTSAGKTGTSQVQEGGSKKDKEGKTRYQITFCGYFPADNPMYTCLVYVRDHKKGGTGSVCGEVYKKVAEKAYILHTQRKDTTVQANWDLANIDKQEITAQQLKNQLTGEVPNVTGLSMDQAVYLLENQQINTEIKGYGKVKEQSIMPGTPVDKVKKITLIGENKWN